MTKNFQIVLLSLLTAVFAGAADAQTTLCATVGGGGSADATSAVIASDALRDGAFACDGAGVFHGAGEGVNALNRSSSGGSTTSATATLGAGFSYAASELGSNHVNVDAAGVFPSDGDGANADSAWGDLLAISGPGSGSVEIRFDGHLDGVANVYGSGDIASSRTLFSLSAATATAGGFYLRGDIGRSDTWSALTNGSSFLPITGVRTSAAIHDSFAVTAFLPINALFGLEAVLSSQARNGGYANFSNTAAIDRITLPSGYSLTSHGNPLSFDGVGYSYVTTPVPEPSELMLLIAGGAMLGEVARRRRKLSHR